MAKDIRHLRLSCKQGARSIGVRDTKWPQAGKTAFRKVALCLLDHTPESIGELLFAMTEVLTERANGSAERNN